MYVLYWLVGKPFHNFLLVIKTKVEDLFVGAWESVNCLLRYVDTYRNVYIHKTHIHGSIYTIYVHMWYTYVHIQYISVCYCCCCYCNFLCRVYHHSRWKWILRCDAVFCCVVLAVVVGISLCRRRRVYIKDFLTVFICQVQQVGLKVRIKTEKRNEKRATKKWKIKKTPWN